MHFQWLNTLRLAAILAGLPMLVYWAGKEQALDLESGFSVGLLGGIALSQLSMVLYAIRFRTVLTTVGIHLPIMTALRMTALSLFYYFFVPLSVGSDITKFVKLKAANHNAFDSASAIVIDHMVGLSSLIILAGSVFIWHRPIDIDVPTAAGGALIMVVVLGIAVGALRYHRSHSGRDSASISNLLKGIWRHRFTVLFALALALAMHSSMILAVFVGSHHWGFDIAFTDMMFVMATAMMFQAIPFTLAGAGVAEAAGTGLYLAVGLPLPAALLLVSLVYGFRLLMAIVGGVWDLLPDNNGHNRIVER